MVNLNNKGNKSTKPYDNDHILHQYADSFCYDGKRKINCKGLGERFASINAFFLDYLKEYQLPVAFIKIQNKNSLRYLSHEELGFYVKILNICDKRTAKIFSKKQGEALTVPLFEYHYRNGNDAIISESHLFTFELCSQEEIKIINRLCSKVNAILKSYFDRRNSVLAEVSCYFGRREEKIYLINDFTPDSLKVISMERIKNPIDPYNFKSAPSIKKYTELLHKQVIS
jgi:phosphoribosylaminoimidazole-succinocarboxamide synthase